MINTVRKYLMLRLTNIKHCQKLLKSVAEPPVPGPGSRGGALGRGRGWELGWTYRITGNKRANGYLLFRFDIRLFCRPMGLT